MRGLTSVGEFGLALAVATPIFVLSGAGLRLLQAVDASSETDFASYAGARCVGLAAAAIVTLAIGAVPLESLPFDIFLAVTLMKCAEGLCEVA